MQDHFASSVHFTTEDYLRLRKNYNRWWQDDLNRPIVPIITTGHPSWRKESPYRPFCFGNAWDLSVTPQQLVDAHDWQLSQMRFHGDAFPSFAFTAFGAGVIAAFLGCTPLGHEDTVWFKSPDVNRPIEELHFEMDLNNPCLRRVIALYETAMEKWRGSVVLTMADLGGIMDVLASFRGENLLLDLYDSPDEVLRCIKELQELWFQYFDMFTAIMGSEAMGYSDWYGNYEEKPTYILQSDFSYMISPKMFDTFVAPELANSASRLYHPMYHLDGIGQLPHLDSILAMDDIKGIQWVPGAGAPEKMDWTEVLCRILASGKKLIAHGLRPDGRPIDIAGNLNQLYFNDRYYHVNDLRAAQEYGALYGIDVK